MNKIKEKTMNSLQKQVNDFMKKMNWQYWDNSKIIAKIKEETGELEKEIASGDKEKIETEFGDLLYAISCFANNNNLDQDECLKKSVAKFGARDKNRYPEGK